MVKSPIPIDIYYEEGEKIILETGCTNYREWARVASEMDYLTRYHFIWAHWVMVF